MTPHERILLDNTKAHDFASKYLAAVDGEMFARCLMLTSAMQKFQEFLHLPASASQLKALFDMALTVVTLVQPELFFTVFLREEEQAVKVALTISEATGSKAAKAIKTAEKVRERAEKVKGAVEKYDAHKEKQEKKRQPAEAAENLKKLDSSKEPVKQMLAAYQKAQGIWSGALDVLDQELENRLNSDPNSAPPKESLEAMAQRLLKLPATLSEDELEQIESLYLWKITSSWVTNNVTVVTDFLGHVTFDGINDTQMETLQEWFGFDAKRGRIFYEAYAFPQYPYLTLTRLGAKEKKGPAPSRVA